AKAAVVTKGQGFSDTTIKVGATFPLSGALAFIGQQSAGAIDAAVKMINARGGIHGRKLQLITYDDAFDPGQVVGNVKRLWEQDKVSMVFAFVVDSANDYVKSKDIPFFTFGGSPGGFATKYPTIIPVGGSFLTWGQQVAHAVTKYMDRHPKVVAVMTDSVILNTHVTAKYIEDYWKKLGAEKVIIEPVNMTQGDCSSQVLKYRQEGVEYWDWQSFAFVLCMPAMERLGWKPPLGQGGPVASMSVLSSAIGKSMEGVVAGAPADMFDGRPRFTGPTKGHLEYTEAIKKYQPGLNGPDHFNSPTTMAYWMAAKFAFEGALNGAAEKYGELSSDAMLKWIYQAKNFDTGISTPIRGFAPDCKQGNNTTWWGLWKWDEGGQKLVNNPLTPHVDNSWYTNDGCFMTKVANEVVK
ncbi:MAG TPA: ABC transporter substrate-binding protein, partial [Acidimicrobiia bacterium]|nr:ABC transporter substrate-binding protein [Acidimicrobiia bacterium]